MCRPSCASSGCQILKMFVHIPCRYEAPPQCEFIMWLFMWLDWENVVLHTLQVYDFSPVWILMCLFRLPDLENVWTHSLHWCGFSPVWTLMWIFRYPDWQNVWSHSLQGCDLSPVCTLIWIFRLLVIRECFVTFLTEMWLPHHCEPSCVSSGCQIRENVWTHSLQECGLSPSVNPHVHFFRMLDLWECLVTLPCKLCGFSPVWTLMCLSSG